MRAYNVLCICVVLPPNLIYIVIYIVFGLFTFIGIKIFNVFINDCILYTTYGHLCQRFSVVCVSMAPTSKHLSDKNVLDIAND
jgi:hypothetical protein